jgi:hypothetical protein
MVAVACKKAKKRMKAKRSAHSCSKRAALNSTARAR